MGSQFNVLIKFSYGLLFMQYAFGFESNNLGPKFERDSWFKEKFKLELDFPNVSDISVFVYILLRNVNWFDVCCSATTQS